MHASKTDGFKMKIPMQQSATKHLTKIMPCLMRKINNKIKLVRKAVSRHTQWYRNARGMSVKTSTM